MTTMEKLFVQTFERKKRIIDQVKHQIDLFDSHLASICLLDGIAPPSWLLSPSFPSISSDLNEMRKEELISGLLLQHSQSVNPHFSSHYSLYQEPIVTACNKGLPNASCTEAYASNNGTDAGDRSSSLPPFPTGHTQCTFSCVPELDGSVTSPPDCTDARISDNFQDPAQSLVKIQRSKSRQRALELRNSAEANKQKSCEENTGAYTCQGVESKINPLQYDHFDELVVGKHFDANNEILREEPKSIESAGKEMNCEENTGAYTCQGVESKINPLQYDHFDELVVGKHFDANNEILREEPKSIESAGKEMNCEENTGAYTCQGVESKINPLQFDHFDELVVGKHFDANNEILREEPKSIESAGKEMNCEENTGAYTCQGVESKINPLQYDHFDELVVGKHFDANNEILREEPKSIESAGKEMNCEENTGAYTCQGVESKINPLQFDHFDELVVGKHFDANNEILREEPKSIESAGKEMNCEENTGAYTCQGVESKINPLQYDHFDELVVGKHFDANNEILREEPKSIESAGKEMNCDIDYDRTIISVANNKEGKGGVNALTPMLEQAATSVASLKKVAAGFSQDCLLNKPEVTDPTSTVFHVMRQHTAEDNEVLLQVSYNEDTIKEMKYHFEAKNSLSHLSPSSPNNLSELGADQNMPEYEGFFIDSDAKRPCTTIEGIDFDNLDLPPIALRRGSALDQLSKSTGLCTPLSHSTAYELHEALNLYNSIPNGLLEGMELKSMLNMVGDESKLLNSSYSCLNEGANDDLHVRSQSVSLLLNSQSAWDISKPCMSPVGKFWDGMPPKSGSSGKRVSSIPELPCISEEKENADGITDTLLEGSCPQVEMSLLKREPLADITKNSIPLTSVCEAEIQDDRSSTALMNTELGYNGTCDRSKKKLRDHNKRRFSSKDKENQNISLGGDGVKRGKGPLHSRFSKPNLSEKPGPRKGGASLSEKEPKRNNIVSNITSFVPLVQQKQAAAVVTGKRDIKVKALEAAEAAKRLAEKKENERKMRKEALKVERAKMEETNLRQLELEKKKKEEEKKKKDADMAAKKRQREEEEKKEKERKKMRVEEAKRNHLEHEKKLQIEKEVKFQAPDERAYDRKDSKKIEKAKVDNNLRTVPGSKPPTTKVSTMGTVNANISMEDHEALSGDNSKVMGFFDKPSENHSLVSNVSQEQSYEISPYKGSDDEDEDEDENVQNNKYKPSWASKSQLALVVSSQQSIDPESIFPPESFCSISEVLLPRRLQQI